MTREECTNCPFLKQEQFYGTTSEFPSSSVSLNTPQPNPFCLRQDKWCESVPHCCVGRDIAAKKQEVLDWVSHQEHIMGEHPIYEIVLYSRDGLYKDDMGLPDRGVEDRPAFYHSLDTAIRAMHENWGDIAEYLFTCGFVYAKFPGTYPDGHTPTRIFFRWNDKLGGFYEAEEPATWAHINL